MIPTSSRCRSSASRTADATERTAASVRTPPRKRPAPRSERDGVAEAPAELLLRLGRLDARPAAARPPAISAAARRRRPGCSDHLERGRKRRLLQLRRARRRDPGRRAGTARGPRRCRRCARLGSRAVRREARRRAPRASAVGCERDDDRRRLGLRRRPGAPRLRESEREQPRHVERERDQRDRGQRSGAGSLRAIDQASPKT